MICLLQNIVFRAQKNGSQADDEIQEDPCIRAEREFYQVINEVYRQIRWVHNREGGAVGQQIIFVHKVFQEFSLIRWLLNFGHLEFSLDWLV